MANNVDDIAAKLAAKLYQPEPQPEPTEPDAEQDAEPVGKSSVIPGAGNQPELTDEQLQALAAQAGPESTHQKHVRLGAMLQEQHVAHQWYGSK